MIQDNSESTGGYDDRFSRSVGDTGAARCGSGGVLCSSNERGIGMDERTRRKIQQELELGAIRKPSMEELERAMWEASVPVACPHGCYAEPDGYCPHGRPSWLLVMGLI